VATRSPRADRPCLLYAEPFTNVQGNFVSTFIRVNGGIRFNQREFRQGDRVFVQGLLRAVVRDDRNFVVYLDIYALRLF
jgi:hypothetical protein